MCCIREVAGCIPSCPIGCRGCMQLKACPSGAKLARCTSPSAWPAWFSADMRVQCRLGVQPGRPLQRPHGAQRPRAERAHTHRARGRGAVARRCGPRQRAWHGNAPGRPHRGRRAGAGPGGRARRRSLPARAGCALLSRRPLHAAPSLAASTERQLEKALHPAHHMQPACLQIYLCTHHGIWKGSNRITNLLALCDHSTFSIMPVRCRLCQGLLRAQRGRGRHPWRAAVYFGGTRWRRAARHALPCAQCVRGERRRRLALLLRRHRAHPQGRALYLSMGNSALGCGRAHDTIPKSTPQVDPLLSLACSALQYLQECSSVLFCMQQGCDGKLRWTFA